MTDVIAAGVLGLVVGILLGTLTGTAGVSYRGLKLPRRKKGERWPN